MEWSGVGWVGRWSGVVNGHSIDSPHEFNHKRLIYPIGNRTGKGGARTHRPCLVDRAQTIQRFLARNVPEHKLHLFGDDQFYVGIGVNRRHGCGRAFGRACVCAFGRACVCGISNDRIAKSILHIDSHTCKNNMPLSAVLCSVQPGTTGFNPAGNPSTQGEAAHIGHRPYRYPPITATRNQLRRIPRCW